MSVVLASLIASANAFAAAPVNANSSWAQVLASNDVVVVAPYAQQLGTLGVFGACATATEIKSIAPQKVCVESAQVPGTGTSDVDYPPQYQCVRYEEKVLSMSRKGMADSCVEYGYENFGGDGEYWVCKKHGMAPYEVGLTQTVDVIHASGDNYPSVAFTKSFTIPACAQ